MGFLDGIKARKALAMHQKGNTEGALAEYERLYAEGYVSAAYMLPYSVLLLRKGGEENCLKVKEMLKKADRDLRPLPFRAGISIARKLMSR